MRKKVEDHNVFRQILLGTFIHSKSRTELEYMHNAAVAVNSHGTIAAVALECDSLENAKEKVLRETGWSDEEDDNDDEGEIHVVQCAGEGQFFFPGFVGQYFKFLQTTRFVSSCLFLFLDSAVFCFFTSQSRIVIFEQPRVK